MAVQHKSLSTLRGCVVGNKGCCFLSPWDFKLPQHWPWAYAVLALSPGEISGELLMSWCHLHAPSSDCHVTKFGCTFWSFIRFNKFSAHQAFLLLPMHLPHMKWRTSGATFHSVFILSSSLTESSSSPEWLQALSVHHCHIIESVFLLNQLCKQIQYLSVDAIAVDHRVDRKSVV